MDGGVTAGLQDETLETPTEHELDRTLTLENVRNGELHEDDTSQEGSKIGASSFIEMDSLSFRGSLPRLSGKVCIYVCVCRCVC